MQRIVVNDELAQKLIRFPRQLRLCDEKGYTLRIVERLAERPEKENLSREAELSEQDILQTLREVFANS